MEKKNAVLLKIFYLIYLYDGSTLEDNSKLILIATMQGYNIFSSKPI
jgi:hypothetical protein